LGFRWEISHTPKIKGLKLVAALYAPEVSKEEFETAMANRTHFPRLI